MGQRYSILYVDDDLQNLFVFRTLLTEVYTVHTAQSGLQALELLEQHPVQVIFVDQRMPEMNGIQLLQKVSQRHPDIIRVLVTGYSDIDVVIGAINRGAVYRYISKPWDNEEIRTTVRNAIEIYELKKRNRDLMASLDAQNRLLRRSIEELRFLNELSLTLREAASAQTVAETVIRRLKEKLGAEEGFRAEQVDGRLVPPPDAHSGLRELLEGLDPEAGQEALQVPFPAPQGDRHLLLLPLAFQQDRFGCLLFVLPDGLDPSRILFARAAAHVAAAALYSERVHRDNLSAERFLILGRTAGMIVHDLKGPLTSMLGFVSLLRGEDDGEARGEYCTILEQELSRLMEMIEELLSFSRGEVHLQHDAIPLRSFIQEILELFAVGLEKDGISVEVELTDGQLLQADRRKLRKVFINLLNNAREALRSRCDAAAGPRIWIKSVPAGNQIRLLFGNNGPSVPPELLPRLFDPFFSYRKKNGTGLGLTICRKIVEEHGGSIQVHSEPQRTEFLILLPAGPA